MSEEKRKTRERGTLLDVEKFSGSNLYRSWATAAVARGVYIVSKLRVLVCVCIARATTTTKAVVLGGCRSDGGP